MKKQDLFLKSIKCLESHICYQFMHLFLVRWLCWGTGTGCAERWWMPRPWRHSRSGWTGLWEPDRAVGVLVRCRGAGVMTFKGPFQLKWLYDWTVRGVSHASVVPLLGLWACHWCSWWLLVPSRGKMCLAKSFMLFASRQINRIWGTQCLVTLQYYLKEQHELNENVCIT